MEKRRAVTFFIKTLADDQRRGSYCWKTPSPFPVHTSKRSWIHTVKHTPSNTQKLKCTQSSTFLHPPPHSCFQTSAESCVPLSHLLSKVTIKDAECVYVCEAVRLCLCTSVLEGEVAASENILIGKLYLRAPRDCAATVNDLSEKCIPECTWGALAPGRLLNDLWERDSC